MVSEAAGTSEMAWSSDVSSESGLWSPAVVKENNCQKWIGFQLSCQENICLEVDWISASSEVMTSDV